MPVKATAQNCLAITPSHTPLAQSSHMAMPKVDAAGMSPVPLYCKVTWHRGMWVSGELGTIILSMACMHVEYLKAILLNMKKYIFKNLFQEP